MFAVIEAASVPHSAVVVAINLLLALGGLLVAVQATRKAIPRSWVKVRGTLLSNETDADSGPTLSVTFHVAQTAQYAAGTRCAAVTTPRALRDKARQRKALPSLRKGDVIDVWYALDAPDQVALTRPNSWIRLGEGILVYLLGLLMIQAGLAPALALF